MSNLVPLCCWRGVALDVRQELIDVRNRLDRAIRLMGMELGADDGQVAGLNAIAYLPDLPNINLQEYLRNWQVAAEHWRKLALLFDVQSATEVNKAARGVRSAPHLEKELEALREEVE